MQKETEDDLQGFWVLIQGNTDQAQCSTRWACRVWAMKTDSVCPPHKLTAQQWHTTDMHNGDTVAPERGWLGSPLSTKSSDWQRQMLEAPWRVLPPSPGVSTRNAGGLPRGKGRA